MATVLRKTDPLAADMAAAVNNAVDYTLAQLRLAHADLVTAGATTPTMLVTVHNDTSESTITSADADGGADDSGLQGCIDLVNELTAVYKFHMADTFSHKVAGVALTSYAKVATQAAAITQANDIRTKYETHRASTTYHYVADSTNTISSSAAVTLSDLVTLVNELKAKINLHMADGPACKHIRLVSA